MYCSEPQTWEVPRLFALLRNTVPCANRFSVARTTEDPRIVFFIAVPLFRFLIVITPTGTNISFPPWISTRKARISNARLCTRGGPVHYFDTAAAPSALAVVLSVGHGIARERVAFGQRSEEHTSE